MNVSAELAAESLQEPPLCSTGQAHAALKGQVRMTESDPRNIGCIQSAAAKGTTVELDNLKLASNALSLLSPACSATCFLVTTRHQSEAAGTVQGWSHPKFSRQFLQQNVRKGC